MSCLPSEQQLAELPFAADELTSLHGSPLAWGRTCLTPDPYPVLPAIVLAFFSFVCSLLRDGNVN